MWRTRLRRNEEVRVGGVRVVLLGVQDGRALIGVDAGESVSVVRTELLPAGVTPPPGTGRAGARRLVDAANQARRAGQGLTADQALEAMKEAKQ